MNYKVLYRKYRPDSFENLIGQKPIVDILKNSIIEGKIAHAYIFSGPRGTGKTSTARILAKSINCLEPKKGIACGKCTNCTSFGTSPDIIEIDAASNNGVDEIRELINNVKIMPTASKYKVYIIDEVHMLSQSAFNALLLTLEEPPAHVVFILATTNLENVPITILSRCQKFDFKRINSNDIFNRLQYVCEQEKIAYDDDALLEIATLSDGGMRDALSLLDQLSKNSDKISMDLIVNEVGTISNKKLEDLINNIDKSNIDSVEKIVNELRNVNLNYKVVIKKLIDLLSKYAIENLKNGSSGHLNYDDYKQMIIDLNDLINKINVSVDPYTILEIMLLGYCKQKENISKYNQENGIKTVSDEIKPPAKELNENLNKESAVSSQKIIDVRINNCFVGASKEHLNDVKRLWEQFNDEASAKVKGMIADTIPVTASDSYIIIETIIKHKDKELNNDLDLIQKEFSKMTNKDYKIIFVDEEKWNKEKNKYIDNIKKGFKYSMMEENSTQSLNSIENDNLEELATNIFGTDKIEIK